MDCNKVQIEYEGQSIEPSRGCFALARVMARYPGTVYSRVQLMDILGMSEKCDDRSVDSRVKLIRRELQKIGLSGAIKTRPGLGYAWSEDYPAIVVEPDPDAFVFRSE